MSGNRVIYTAEEVIDILEKRDFGKFSIFNGAADIYTRDMVITIQAKKYLISEEDADAAARVLRSFDECVSKARAWLKHFSLKGDRWYPDALDRGYEVNQLYVGEYSSGPLPFPHDSGFMMTFGTVNHYPCGFVVKFHRNMVPFAVEEFVL